MASRPKILVTWKQPRRFREQMRQVEMRAVNWWVMPALAVGLASLFLLQWYLATLKGGPNKPPPFENALVVALGGGFLMIYGVAWIIRAIPSSITVTQDGFRREKWGMSFERIAAHAWFPAAEFSTLLLVDKDGGRTLLGVPKDETEIQLRAILRERSVPEDPTLKPFVEEELQPTFQGGLAMVGPFLVVALYFGLLGAHTALIVHLSRESKITREHASRDWLKTREGLIQEGISPEKVPVNPIEQHRSSPKAIAIQRYLLFAPMVCLTAILFMAIAVLTYRMKLKRLEKLFAEKEKPTGFPAQITSPGPATD